MPSLVNRGNILEVEDLGMFDPPPRLAHLSLLGQDGSERLLVKIENRPVRTVPDCMGFDLDSAAQSFVE